MNISIYLDEPLHQKLRQVASLRRVSVSRYIRDTLQKDAELDFPSKPLRTLANAAPARLGGNALEDTENLYA